jgi:hypothetical protein
MIHRLQRNKRGEKRGWADEKPVFVCADVPSADVEEELRFQGGWVQGR